MPRKIVAALLFMILRNVVLERRVREAAHLRPFLEKEKEGKEEVEKVLSLQGPMPVLRRRASEALVPRENLNRHAAKNGEPVEPVNGETNANIGMFLRADSSPRATAKVGAPARFLTESARTP